MSKDNDKDPREIMKASNELTFYIIELAEKHKLNNVEIERVLLQECLKYAK